MIGRTYLERGRPVTVLVRWYARRGAPPDRGPVVWLHPPRRAPRNVLVRRETGELAVRPFRGLRRLPVDGR